MVLVLLKCYGSVESSSEEEFAGFPEEDSTMSGKIPQFPIVLPSETDSVRRFGWQLLNRSNLEEAAIVKLIVLFRPRVEIIIMNSKYWSLNYR